MRPCPSIEDVAGLAGLPGADPRRAHLRDCPRCRAILLSYNSFMDETGAATTPGRERAEARLAAAIARAAAAPAGAEDQPVPHLAGGTGGEAQRGRRLRSLRSRSTRMVLGLAAAVAIGLGMWAVLRPGPEGEGAPILRGPIAAPAGAEGWRLAPPARLGDGSVRLAWGAPEAGLSHRVEVYDAGLALIASFGPTPASEIVMPVERLGELAAAPRPWRWRVILLRDGDAVGQSPMAALEPAGP